MNNTKRQFMADMVVTIISNNKIMSKYLVNPKDEKVCFDILLRAEKDYKKDNIINITVTIKNQDIFIKEHIQKLYYSLMADPKMEELFQHIINKICKDSNRKPEDITVVIDNNAQSHI